MQVWISINNNTCSFWPLLSFTKLRQKVCTISSPVVDWSISFLRTWKNVYIRKFLWHALSTTVILIFLRLELIKNPIKIYRLCCLPLLRFFFLKRVCQHPFREKIIYIFLRNNNKSLSCKSPIAHNSANASSSTLPSILVCLPPLPQWDHNVGSMNCNFFGYIH